MRSVGRNVPRKEGLDKVTGRALYVDDRTFPGMLHGRTIRSTIAAGEIEGIHLGFGRKGFTFVQHDVSSFIWVPGTLDNVLHFASPASPRDYLEYPIATLKVAPSGRTTRSGSRR